MFSRFFRHGQDSVSKIPCQVLILMLCRRGRGLVILCWRWWRQQLFEVKNSQKLKINQRALPLLHYTTCACCPLCAIVRFRRVWTVTVLTSGRSFLNFTCIKLLTPKRNFGFKKAGGIYFCSMPEAFIFSKILFSGASQIYCGLCRDLEIFLSFRFISLHRWQVICWRTINKVVGNMPWCKKKDLDFSGPDESEGHWLEKWRKFLFPLSWFRPKRTPCPICSCVVPL